MRDRPELGAWRPLALWALALGAFDVFAGFALRWVGPSYDFAPAGRPVVGHIADRSLTPIPVIQNAPGAWPLLLGLIVAFVIAYFAYDRILRAKDLRAPFVWGAFGIGIIAALAVPFFPTSDPYAYAMYALEAGPLHLDPYLTHVLPATASSWSAPLSAIFPDTQSYVRVSNYGPVAAFAYGLLAWPLSHAPLSVFLYAERLFGALLVALTGYALSRSAPGEQGLRRVASFILNPLVILELIAFAHGDALMMVFLAFAFAAWKRGAVGAAAALCVLALATRSVAVLALGALFLALLRTDRTALPRAFVGAALAGTSIALASFALYGEVSLGGVPAFNRFSAPLVMLASQFFENNALLIGVVIQAAFGAILLVFISRRWWSRPLGSGLAWLPFGALAALPTIYPHYLTWVVATGSVSDDERFRAAARVATLIAPLFYIVRMNVFPAPGPSPLASAAVLLVTWGTVLAYLALRGQPGAALRERSAYGDR
jgi:hypothetical protein